MVSVTGNWIGNDKFQLNLPPGEVISAAWMDEPNRADIPLAFDGHTLTVKRSASVRGFRVIATHHTFSGAIPA